MCEKIPLQGHFFFTMESENISVTEQGSNNWHSLVSTEYIEEDSKNIPEGNTVDSDSSTNRKTDTNFTDKGSSSVEIDLNNISKMTENSIYSVFLRTALQNELDFEDQLHEIETSHCEHSGGCQTEQEGNLICPAEEKSMKNCDDPQLARGDEDSKVFPGVGMNTTYQPGQWKDDLEEGEVKDTTPSPEQSSRQSCPVYGRGKCISEDSCKNLHLSTSDKGNYSMFSPVRLPPAPVTDRNGFEKRFVPYFYGPCFLWGMPSLPAPMSVTPPECPWERDLKDTKELMIKSKLKKGRETNFGEERRTSESDGKYAVNQENYKKNRNLKNNPYKGENEIRNPYSRNSHVSDTDREGKSLRTYRFKQTKPIYKIHNLYKTGKRDDKQTTNTRLSIQNYETSKRLGIQTAGPRGDGQRDGPRRIKYEKTAGKRFRSTSRSLRSSDTESPKLSKQKKSSNNMEMVSLSRKMDPKTNLRLRNTNYSSKNRYSSSTLPLKSSVSPEYSNNGKVNSISYAKGNIYQNTDRQAKKFWQKSFYGDFLSLAAERATKNKDHKIKLKSRSLSNSSFSASGSRITLAKRKLSHYPVAVTSSQSLSSKCMPGTKASSLAAGYSKSFSKHPPTKSRLSLELSSPSSSLSSTNTFSSVSSITSSSSLGSRVISQTKTRPWHRFQNEMEHLIHYNKQRYNENIAARAAKDKHSFRHSKQEMRTVASITGTLSHGTAAKNLKNSSKYKNNVVKELSNKALPILKRDRKIKESNMLLHRAASKPNSMGAQHFSSASCKPTVKCVTRKPRSRKEKMLLLLSAIEDAIARKKVLLK